MSGTSLIWASDRSSVKITKTTSYAAGDYTVSISDVSKSFKIEAENLAQISINAEHIFAANNQDLKVSFENQYGAVLSLSAYTSFTLNASCPTKPAITLGISKNSAGFILSGAQNLAANDVVRLIIVENTTGTAVTKDITISESPKVTSFSFGQLQIASGSSKVLVSSSGHYITVNAKDQYNQTYTILPTDVGLNKPVILTSSDTLIIDASKITVSGGKLYFPTGSIGSKEGTVTLTAVGQTISSSIQITVSSSSVITTLNITGAEGIIYVNEWTAVNATAKDQYGNNIALDTLDGSKLMMISSNASVIPNANIRFNIVNKKIEIKGITDGLATLHISYNSIAQGSLDIQILATPVPTYITDVSIPVYYQKNSVFKLSADIIKIADQYEKEITLTSSHSIIVTSSNISGAKFTEGIVTGAGYTMNAPATSGMYMLTFTLKNGAAIVSTYDVTLVVVDDDKIVNYQIQDISAMYGGASDTSTDTGHWKPIAIVGKLASNQFVNLAYTGTLPTGIDQITCTNSSGANNFIIEDVAGVKTLKAQNVIGTMSTSIKIWKSGQEIHSINVTASGTAPVLTTLNASSSNITKSLSAGSFQIAPYVVALDQYGVAMTLATIPGGITYMTTKPAVATINSSGIVTPISTGICEIKAYFNSYDKTLAINLTVN
ncbi:MAG TPA: hypothetical protein PL054_00495 [Clostridia bacterium]|nr:hypothetical protein [Clostridia bacterium]